MISSFQNMLSEFAPIYLSDLEKDAFFTRRDRKYLGHRKVLPELLLHFMKDWKVLEVDKERNQHYTSQYYDSLELQSFYDHHNERNNRQKFRLRTYENGVQFFEIKTKNNKGLIEKNRILLDKDVPCILPGDFIQNFSKRGTVDLKKNIIIDYDRITLLNEHTDEKMTIDTNISFSENGVSKSYHSLLILELKQKVFSKNLDTIIDLRNFDLNRVSCSKYCLGILNLRDGIKQNRFKRKIRMIEKIERVAV